MLPFLPTTPCAADAVVATELATVLGDDDGPLVSTAEHVLAALRGMGVDNATIGWPFLTKLMW